MITLYGSRSSGSAAIEMALRRCKLGYRIVRASTWEPDSERAELLGVNPLGQIPTLVVEDGSVLTESAAILIHLGLTHPESGLLPTAAAARAQCLRGLVYIAANCYAAISVGDYPERWTTATTKPAREKVRLAARQQLHRSWDLFADAFANAKANAADPFLSGAAAGALDYLAVVVSRWSGTRAHLTAARPLFSSTLAHIEADPLVAAVLADHAPLPPPPSPPPSSATVKAS